jgi:hypothetical protein
MFVRCTFLLLGERYRHFPLVSLLQEIKDLEFYNLTVFKKMLFLSACMMLAAVFSPHTTFGQMRDRVADRFAADINKRYSSCSGTGCGVGTARAENGVFIAIEYGGGYGCRWKGCL